MVKAFVDWKIGKGRVAVVTHRAMLVRVIVHLHSEMGPEVAALFEAVVGVEDFLAKQ